METKQTKKLNGSPTLKGKQPASLEKRFKCLFYGQAGSGKTTACIQFPKPYLIDTERGAENDQYTRMLEKQGGAIFQTNDFEEVLNEVKTLLSVDHDYKTLVIDPMTNVYNNLLDEFSIKVGTDFGKHYNEANKSMKRLLNLLLRLDMNVIVTAHSKNEYGDEMKVLGQTFDCYKKLDYLFDLVVEIQKRGKKRMAVVRKTRVENFNELDAFEFSYDVIAEKYGRQILEKKSVVLKMADKEQVEELKALIDLLNTPDDTVKKWLDKAGATAFEEMEQSQVQACIDLLAKKLTINKKEAKNEVQAAK